MDSFGFGLGGEFPERLGRVSALRIGSLSLKGPTTSFSTARRGATSGSSYDGTIGGEVLRRFKVILDYAHQEMILEPGSDFSEPWAADSSGLLLRAGRGSEDNIGSSMFSRTRRRPLLALRKETSFSASINRKRWI